MSKYVFPCRLCGESFEASRNDARTCSDRCRNALRDRHRRDRDRRLGEILAEIELLRSAA